MIQFCEMGGSYETIVPDNIGSLDNQNISKQFKTAIFLGKVMINHGLLGYRTPW